MPTVGIVFELSLRPAKAAKPVTVEPPTVFKMQEAGCCNYPKDQYSYGFWRTLVFLLIVQYII